MRKPLLTGLFAVLITTISFAQSGEKKGMKDLDYKKMLLSDWSITPSVGITQFYGDLRVYDFYPVETYGKGEVKYAFGLSLNKHVTNTLALHGGFYYGSLQGTKRFFNSKIYQGGVYFNTNIFQYYGGARINIKNFFFPESTKFNKKFGFFAFANAGFISFDSELKNLRDDSKPVWIKGKTSPGPTTEVVTTLGGMAKWHINPKMDLGVEMSYNSLFSDKLDGWIEANSARDGWGYGAINFTYHISNKKDEEPLEWSVAESDVTGQIEDLEDKIDGVEDKVDELEKKKPEPAPVATPTEEPKPDPDPDPEPTPTPTPTSTPADLSQLDTDRDGVPDNRDKELFSPGGAKVNSDGVAEDSDGDGVPNVIDLEPNTPKGSLVNFKGQKIEVSQTIIKNGGGNNNTGRPVGAGDEKDRIYFNDASAEVLSTEAAKLDAYVSKMKAQSGLKIKIVGQASFYGEEDFNLYLSKQRANAAKDYMVQKGIAANRISVEGIGEVEHDPNASSSNRRVTIIEQ